MTGSSLQTVPGAPARDAGIRLKFLSTKIGSGKTPRGGADAYVENGVLFIRSQNVHPDGLHLDDIVRIPLDVDAEMYGTRVRPGDVLLNITGASIGRAAPVPFGLETANVNQHVCIIRPDPNHLVYHFLHYALISQIVQSQIFTAENGISREGLNFEQVGDLLIPSPGSLRQQQSIVAFLDRETAKIDALIAKQTEFLALLDEHRQALVTEVVTNGLDRSVAMQQTGIASLPSIPAHWKVRPLKRIAMSWCDGPFGTGLKSDHYTEHGIRVVRLQNIGMGAFLDSDQAFVSKEHFESLGGHDVRPGDLLIAGLGDEGNPLGRACVYPAGGSPAMVKADCFRVRLRDDSAMPHFVANYLSSAVARGLVSEVARGSTRARINLSSAISLPIPVPPLSEQKVIVNKLLEQVGKAKTVQVRSTDMIERLCERRAALIAAAVTGQIDVTRPVLTEAAA